MFCSNCGKQLIEGKKFCAYCGKPVETGAMSSEAAVVQPQQTPAPTPAPQLAHPAQQPSVPQPAPQPQPAYPAQQPPATQPPAMAWQAGTQLTPQQPIPQPALQTTKPRSGKKKTGLIIALVAAVVVIAVVAAVIAIFVVPSCSSKPPTQAAVEGQQEKETEADKEATEEEPEDNRGSDNQNENQQQQQEEETVADERLDAFEGTLYESTTLPLSFMLPPDYTVDENSSRILCISPTGLAQVQTYRIAGISATEVAADQEKYNRDAITRFNGNLYEFTSAENVVYYGTTWYKVVFKSNDADGNLINYWLTYTDDGKGGVVFCAYGLFFGPSGTASIEELVGLDIPQSMKLD
jgi:hypothetical protein